MSEAEKTEVRIGDYINAMLGHLYKALKNDIIHGYLPEAKLDKAFLQLFAEKEINETSGVVQDCDWLEYPTKKVKK